jgi:putative FmdB family regulatory protein
MSPMYEYSCAQGHHSSIHVSMLARPKSIMCPTCGKPADRVFHPVHVRVQGGTPKFHHEPGKGR